METKICSKCGKEQPITEFQARGKENPKPRNECRECLNTYHRLLYSEKVGKFKRTVRAEVREADPKKCIKCGMVKPLSEFTFHNRTKGQHRNFCHDCEKEMIKTYHKSDKGKEKGKEWYDANQDKIQAYKEFYKSSPEHRAKSKAYHKKKWLSDKYGLTLEQYEGMLEKQGYCCAICKNGRPDVKGKKTMFHVDHDHTTGKVRGLLCHNCNVSIGLMKDSPHVLRQAAEYLETHNPF
jgi:hypothetical protein